jgi:hypothetical protein
VPVDEGVEKMTTKSLIAAATLLLVSSVASANVQYTFYANGVTENYAQQGIATFSFADDGSSLAITLTDTVDPTADIQSEISGLQFALSFAPTTMTLTSVSASQVIDCTNASSPCPAGSGTSPYGWGATFSGNSFVLGAGFDGTTFAYQPYGIVNENYVSLADGGGLSTPSNNPLLVGPVTLNFALTGLRFAPEVQGVVFAFGDPAFLPAAAAVPEPEPLALIALGLLAAVWVGRRKQHRV